MKFSFFVAVIAATAILMTSCKKEQSVSEASSSKQKTSVAPANKRNIAWSGGEDDDGPIIMHLVVDETSQPLQSADVTMTNNYNTSDSFHMVTNTDGKCTFKLPKFGQWRVKIRRSNYQGINTVVNLQDSFSVKTSVLQE